MFKILGVEHEDQDLHQSIPNSEIEDQRARWRTSQRIRRASMSSEQRENGLAQRRANYQGHGNQSLNHQGSNQELNRMRLSHVRQLARLNRPQVPDNEVDHNAPNESQVNEGKKDIYLCPFQFLFQLFV